MRNRSGITLIAIVITIIIMIILAGVSLNIGIGDNGLINKTGKTANNYNYDTTYEELYAQILEAQAEDIRTEPTIKSVLKYLKNKYGNDEYIIGREKEKAIIVFDDIDDLDDDVDKVVVKYKGYEFEFDSNLKLAIFDNKKDWKTPVLPFAYQQVEYIESTGTQYIDVGTKMYTNSELELCFSFNEMQENCSIFGSRTSLTANNFEIASTNDFPIYLDFGHYNTSRATYNNAVINTKYICTISKSLRAVYDENRTLLVRNTTIISADNTTPSNARIFDTVGGYSQNKLKGKVYYCKIWENGVLVRNMIPCKNPSNVAGMYDTVNGVFYTNAGTGTFEKGDDV